MSAGRDDAKSWVVVAAMADGRARQYYKKLTHAEHKYFKLYKHAIECRSTGCWVRCQCVIYNNNNTKELADNLKHFTCDQRHQLRSANTVFARMCPDALYLHKMYHSPARRKRRRRKYNRRQKDKVKRQSGPNPKIPRRSWKLAIEAVIRVGENIADKEVRGIIRLLCHETHRRTPMVVPNIHSWVQTRRLHYLIILRRDEMEARKRKAMIGYFGRHNPPMSIYPEAKMLHVHSVIYHIRANGEEISDEECADLIQRARFYAAVHIQRRWRTYMNVKRSRTATDGKQEAD